MAGHLASATVRVFLLAQEAKELVAGGLAEEQGHTRVAVVGIQEIVAGAQVIGGADLGGLLALAGDNERSLALAVEDPGSLIDPPREEPKLLLRPPNSSRPQKPAGTFIHVVGLCL